MASVPMTVVEVERFLKDAGSLLSDSERGSHLLERTRKRAK